VCEAIQQPAPHRDFDIDLRSVDVIYAEDEEIFRETAVRELVKAGFNRDNIYESENGMGALEDLARLQVKGNLTMPLVVLLDVRMPGMDGRECALQIQELVKSRHLRREPFVICISSIHRQIVVDEGKGNFQIVLPKPFSTKDVSECVEMMRRWWTLGVSRTLAAWKPFELSEIDFLAVYDEPICRMYAAQTFQKAGVPLENITEAEDQEELREKTHEAAIQEFQEKITQSKASIAKWREYGRRHGEDVQAHYITNFVDAGKGQDEAAIIADICVRRKIQSFARPSQEL